MSKTEIEIRCADGQILAASLFTPDHSNGLSAQINGATGVPRRYYEAFATYMASRGYTVLSFDYRGIAGSPHTPGAPLPRMRDWAEQDCVAAQDYLAQRFPALAPTLVCHSFGGQVLGLMPQGDRITAALCIASQHGWWRNWSLSRQPRLALVWYLLVPALLAFGMKSPARLFGGEPLPRGVLADWSRWCRSPHYICDDRGNALRPFNDRVRAAMRLVSFSDDPDFGPAYGVDRLAEYYPQAQIDRLHVSPSDWGLPRIGHFGFFRREMPVQHWAAQVDWLTQAAQVTPLLQLRIG